MATALAQAGLLRLLTPRGQAIAALQGGVAGYHISGRWAWGLATHNAHLVSGCVVLGADGQPELLPSGQPRVLSALFECTRTSRA